MEGFEKIEMPEAEALEKKESKDNIKDDLTSEADKNHKTRNIVVSVLLFFILVIVGIGLAVGIPAVGIFASSKASYAQAKKVIAAAKLQNISLVSDELEKTHQQVLDTQKKLQGIGYARYIPVVNVYYSDATHLINASIHALDGSRVLVDSIIPYQDVLGLKDQGTFAGGTAQQRIQTAVQTLSKITPNIDKIAGYLDMARLELNQVNPNHYPAFMGGEKIKTTLESVNSVADQVGTFIKKAGPLAKSLPTLLGEPTGQKYLVLFQNDKELRPTGGFITAYAIMRFEHGLPFPDSSDDIYTLDATIANKPSAPRPLLTYMPKVPLFNLRDTNLSPDFVTSMDTFNSLYEKAGSYKKVNGIIAIDTTPLVGAIDVLGGSISVDGDTFSTKIDPRCDCPGVIYKLESYADQPVGYIKTNRKGVIGDLMVQIMRQVLASPPKQTWGKLFQVMLTDVSQKHILLYVYDKPSQEGLDALNASGRIRDFDGDYVHINQANFGGAKSNLYVTQDVTQDYTFNSDKTITRKITINYKNPFAPSDCNLERGGLCLNAVLRDWIRIYVPKGSQLIDSQGSQVKLTSYEELGKTVFEGFLTVNPQGIASFNISYKLPFKLDNGSVLPVMYQKQPGTNADSYTVTVNGKTFKKFLLDTDIEFKINP